MRFCDRFQVCDAVWKGPFYYPSVAYVIMLKSCLQIWTLKRLIDKYIDVNDDSINLKRTALTAKCTNPNKVFRRILERVNTWASETSEIHLNCRKESFRL